MNTSKIFSFEKFCKYFGEDKPNGYAPIVDAYIQYEKDSILGGYVVPDGYWKKKKKWKCKICGVEIMTSEVHGHKIKHEKEYNLLVQAQYKTDYFIARNKIISHQMAYVKTLEEIEHNIGKIKITNYMDGKIKMFSILFMSDIPNEYMEFFLHAYLDERTVFSVPAYKKFKQELLQILSGLNVIPVKLPVYPSFSYDGLTGKPLPLGWG